MRPLLFVQEGGASPLCGPIAYLLDKNSENSESGFDSALAILDDGRRIACDLTVRGIHRPG